MKIVIFAGGTGSIALQTGIFNNLESITDNINVKIICNSYDNGLSTGLVRSVLGGKILGPSDVRKNQTTRLMLEKPYSPWNKFLDIRFTRESSKAQEFCLAQIKALETVLNGATYTAPTTNREDTNLLNEAVDVYFTSQLATKIDYTDFSLANIIYAGFAKANGNSLRKAATIMASLMGIADNVLLNDDTSLFLGAITKSGKRITDEGDIVSWGNTEDPFVDIFFTDSDGAYKDPILCKEAEKALMDADYIILSSGTQWSSLIPTYASLGFKRVMMNVSAKVIMIMNRYPDKDSPGQSASDIINILVPRFFPENQLNVILASDGNEIMRELNKSAQDKVAIVNSVISRDPILIVTDADKTKHDPNRLVAAIAQTCFLEYLDSDHFIFDYDDTLIGRGNVFPRASAFNATAILKLNSVDKVTICTGNSIKAINLRGLSFDPNTFGGTNKILPVFADGGANLYNYNTSPLDQSDDIIQHEFVQCVNTATLFETDSQHKFSAENLKLLLSTHGIPLNKIENRGNVLLSIKPIDDEYRPIVTSLIDKLIEDSGLIVNVAGRTTVEIHKPNLSKADAVQFMLNKKGIKTITYVGDELHSGNDLPVSVLAQAGRIKCLNVNNPNQTAFFLMALRTI